MGMYTELVLGVKIKADPNVIGILNYMLSNTDKNEDCDYSHPFFKTLRWDWMLCSDSYCFDGQTDSELIIDRLVEDSPMYFLNVRCNLKNYRDEIQLFLDWLAPYIETRGFIGYTRYEEDEDPTLIYNHNCITYKGVG